MGFFEDYVNLHEKNYKNICIIDDKNKKSFRKQCFVIYNFLNMSNVLYNNNYHR